MSGCMVQKIVLPGQTNSRGSLFGGALLAMVDEAAAIAAGRHARAAVATVHLTSVDFRAPIHVGEVVEICARLTAVGRTSMTVGVEVWGENLKSQDRRFCTSAEVVLVALDEAGVPTSVPPLPPPADPAPSGDTPDRPMGE